MRAESAFYRFAFGEVAKLCYPLAAKVWFHAHMGLPRSKIIAFRLALLVALIAVTYLATSPLQFPVVEDINDKANHLFAFFVLALLADFSFPHTGFGLAKAMPLLGYGLALEFIQYFLPFRSSSLYDLAGDGLGLLVYWFSLPALRHVPWLRARWNMAAKDYG